MNRKEHTVQLYLLLFRRSSTRLCVRVENTSDEREVGENSANDASTREHVEQEINIYCDLLHG